MSNYEPPKTIRFHAFSNDQVFHLFVDVAVSRLLDKGLTIPEAASVSGHKTTLMFLKYAQPYRVKVREKMMQ